MTSEPQRRATRDADTAAAEDVVGTAVGEDIAGDAAAVSATADPANPADPARPLVTTLTSRFALPPAATDQLLALLRLLADDPRAPTTVRDPEAIANDHLADSLVALALPEITAARRIADLGSGAGLPAIPLAVGLPGTCVVSVESNARKCDFQRRAVAASQAHNVAVVSARAEEWRDGLGACDVVTARALAALPVLAEYAAPLLVPGGALVAWRGRRDPDDESAGARAATELGLEPRPPIPVTPYPGAQHRHLHVYVKTASTPPRFPRRPGVARKRPLGAAPRSV